MTREQIRRWARAMIDMASLRIYRAKRLVSSVKSELPEDKHQYALDLLREMENYQSRMETTLDISGPTPEAFDLIEEYYNALESVGDGITRICYGAEDW